MSNLYPKYWADVETTITYEDFNMGKWYRMRPDILVTKTDNPFYPSPAGTDTITAPPIMQDIVEELEIKQFTVNIYTSNGKQLVTTIEILSPANKVLKGKPYEQYTRKRRRLLESPVHLMELDLLRAGKRMIMGYDLPTASYFATLSRGTEGFRKVEIWPILVGSLLPILPIPLLDPDPDIPLDLNQAIAAVYADGRYDYVIDYSQPAPPPVSDEEQAMIKQCLLNHASLEDEGT